MRHGPTIITTDSNGLYRVRREFWDTGDWEVAGVAFWNQNDRFATITDTLENARKLADWAKAQGLTLTSPPRYYFYDGPMTLPWNRRYEVAFTLP